MDPYENIVIGNFLYSLGLCIGQLSVEDVRPMCVNLLQQSPMDHALGDLMVANAGVTRLIEFKRERNPSEKEETKRMLLSRALTGKPHLRPISREIHWYIETSESAMNLVSRVVPYLDFADPQAPTTSIERFTDSMAADAVANEIDAETRAAYEQYVNLVAVSHGGLQGASGGLIVNYSEKDGLRYALVADIRDLLLDHRLVREAYFERMRQQAMELSREQAVRERRLSRGRGR
ncbi:hypothetical protein [Burkholderia pseudomallei]|uniref:hypothetical protein n=2 Tax=Burkholderiaceae TaxID=119060 RepID=UPI000841D482|nr:hypothetical protein [Burkholderia pseudomallei]AOK06921.1 hypothetical protein WK25_20405 [Burkholderia latens]MBO7811055.1 hypothetical protein [Burkholderia pseudomallei]